MITTLSSKEWENVRRALRDQDPAKLRQQRSLPYLLAAAAKDGKWPVLPSRHYKALSQALVDECLKYARGGANTEGGPRFDFRAEAHHPGDGT